MIGWTITSSPFQRRAGLLTLTATTAANRGAYLIYDVEASEEDFADRISFKETANQPVQVAEYELVLDVW